MNETPQAPTSRITATLDILKTFSPVMYAGLALLVLFAGLTQIETCVVRWWLMLPIAAAGCGLLEWRRRSVTGLEARICAIGFWLLAAFFLLRDIGLSRKLAELLDKVNEINSQIGQMGIELNRFFEGGR